ncbi:sigma-70 family RNA polymerase sigma factor [Cystobacter ferrugineus]|uniref:RNA polymerase subunit sigma-70 n=1 Tax=Cystobacter ferrugineus TaxID=83449 RepID=A0A1L9B0T6_9BACT|nr:sigma-70 family RNA polymerase sigma factor [Cystobacter ferrugineus]OJH35861.1 RNA polymerase subunit sigma-70 [Cystobacter ferrugineus]
MSASEVLGSQDVETPERLLLARLRRGEPEAFEALVRENQDRLYDFCVRMLADPEEANDVVQEVFVSAHQHLARFREDSKLSTWLFRIGKNHCLNRLKYLKRRGRGRSDEYGEQSEGALARALGSPPGPDEALEAAREQARVQWAITQLEPDARMLVALRDIEGLSYEEIVDITELPLGTVKSRLHRAREKLAEVLGRLEE